MKRKPFCLFALACLLFVGPAWASTATITIDTAKTGPEINPHMYGIFLEEINHGVDGGLYAELVRNRAFEDSRAPEGYTLRNGRWVDAQGFSAGFSRFGYTTEGIPFWSLVRQGNARGAMHLETTGGVTPQSCYCLRLEVEDASDGRIGVANEGFFGIGVKQGELYALSFYAKADAGFTGSLAVKLEDSAGNACSDEARITGIGTQWTQFKATLTASRTEGKGRLVVAAGARGTVWLDFVSLMPARTWKGRPNGLRSDIAQMIADLRPGFVRFPGGCVVEGGTVETAYDWKLTVGPLEQRQERWGPWMYRRTQGMGLYEYLQFCEDLGAEPLWVGFVGQTCIFRQRENVPMEEMGWVRDGFLDIVEYANGTADSKWGKMRAQAGHPAPFGLKYVEIGNENEGREYGERYRFVYDAMKAKYPDVTYLIDLSWTSLRALGDVTYDIEDRHYYNPPRWFTSRFNEYDDRDRSQPPLYLGEVAVTSNDGGPLRGNLLAALSEGVFLMGCERNGDTVRMVSYAPLLAHVEGRTELTDAPPPWHAMIYHDGTRAFGTVSYHLWKLFGVNRPSHNVRTDVAFADTGPKAIAGAVGVGTWGTTAEFADIRVEADGKVLYRSDFSQGVRDWRPESGRWAVQDGAYRQSRRANGLSVVGDETWSNYTLTLKARKLSGGEGFLIVFGHKGENKYWWNLGGWGNTQHAIEFNQTPVGRPVRGRIETDRWYDVKVELAGERVRCYLDGELIHDVTAPKTEPFFAVAGRDESNGDIVVKAINIGSSPVTATLDLRGTERVGPQATVTVLTSANLSDNNSLEQPDRVSPSEGRIRLAGPRFDHEFAGHALTILRIKTR
jgi:alpha-L-arabinofuranosidase